MISLRPFYQKQNKKYMHWIWTFLIKTSIISFCAPKKLVKIYKNIYLQALKSILYPLDTLKLKETFQTFQFF